MNWGQKFKVLRPYSGTISKATAYSLHRSALEIQHINRIDRTDNAWSKRVSISHWGFVPLGWTEGQTYAE